jgi:F0F1-type ATP synthase membrane subunit b/b'
VRKAFIAFSILAFLVYAWASVAYQNLAAVPDYARIELDLLDGRARADWDADQQGQFQRLMDLENRAYQLPEDAGADSFRPLRADDFSRHIDAHPGQPVMMRLRDTSAFTALLDKKYMLRDPIYNPVNPQGEPLYFGGAPLDKAMLDDLRNRGIPAIAVSGHAPAVNFQIGTAIMIALIFFTLVAALKPTIWDPFTLMLEKRMKQLEQGGEAQRRNQLEADKFAAEREKLNAEVAREIQTLRLSGQRETAKEANAIVRAAREKEKEVKLAGLRGIALAGEAAREAVEKDIPSLAEAIADAVTPKG